MAKTHHSKRKTSASPSPTSRKKAPRSSQRLAADPAESATTQMIRQLKAATGDRKRLALNPAKEDAEQLAQLSPVQLKENNISKPSQSEGSVSPAGFTQIIDPTGQKINIPKSAEVNLFGNGNCRSYEGPDCIKHEIVVDATWYFVIDGISYEASWDPETRAFLGYRDSKDCFYQSPKSLDSSGTVNKNSWGETSGLYPTANGTKSKNLYDPTGWDYDSSNQLMKARAAISLIGTRNPRLHSATPKDTKIEQILVPWHMEENFPSVDAEIKENEDVKYFYLSPDPNAKHTGLNYKTNIVEIEKSYGPFYNIGGGDVKSGPTYVIFYSATPRR